MPDPLTYLLDTITRPAQDRTSRFMARVEAHLAGLPAAERAAFVAGQIEIWRDRYSAWAARVDSGTATPTDLACTAYDFNFTLAALSKKARELANAAPPERDYDHAEALEQKAERFERLTGEYRDV